MSSPRFSVGWAVKPINSLFDPHIFRSMVIPALIFEYHLERRAKAAVIGGAFACAAARSGGADATGMLSPDFASFWNLDPGKGSLDAGGGSFNGGGLGFGFEGADGCEVSPMCEDEVPPT